MSAAVQVKTMSSHLDRFLSVQVYPEQNDNLQEKTPNNKIWDKEIEVGLKLQGQGEGKRQGQGRGRGRDRALA